VAIRPNPEQFTAYMQSDNTGEVVMLNLLKFKPRAEGEDGSGRDAYLRYGNAVQEMIEARGGTLLWQGRADHVFIGDVDANEWDAVALVSYPSRQAFVDMVSTPEYEQAHEHRSAGLADTVVIACTPMVSASA
jgi:uncharacterized protein (DUF1330 family)